ncbi:MAG TPA: hypothetical protein VFV54_03880 [Thermoanaerobaculia bacterium]|nr:hypothetical protein [Thermoanaerobaculia bacterium]
MKLNRRHQFLLGFGGIAVALLVVFNMWYPPVNEDSATGAVGAVKKHRQQQIAASDVILGDEATRKQEQILYGDYLEDAATLENISVDLAMALRSKDAQGIDFAAMKASLDAASKSLDAQSSRLDNRARVAAKSALESMNKALEAAPSSLENKAALVADLQNLDMTLANKARLDSKDMEALSAGLANVSDQIDLALGSASSDDALATLDAVRRDLENKQVDAATLEAAASRLEAVSKFIGKSSALENARLENHEAYLAAMARENKAIENARTSLEAASRSLEAKNALSNAEVLTLEQATRSLAGHASSLENLAVAGLESRLTLVTLENKAVASLDDALGLVSKAIGSKSAQLDAAARQDLELGLKAADLALANRQADLQTASLASANLELAALSRHIDNRASLENRAVEADLFAQSSLDSVSKYLGKMSAQVENRSAIENKGTLDNKQQLELSNKAKELANRASSLESASRE